MQKAKAYITAVITALPAGVDSISYGENLVVEAILTNLNDYYPSYVRMPEVIAHVSAARDRKITDFAIPTINASAEGNFYAWADSLAGIRVGFKRPHETQFAPNNIISFRWFSGYNTRAVDPSLNTYSKIRWSENDCSVAWSEIDPLPSPDTVSDIYYTQVYWDGATLRREIPKKDAYIFWARYNSDSTMILLSKKYNMPNPEYQTRQNRFPVIYRAIDENTDLCPGCPPQMQTLERVYWQGKDIQYDEGNPRRAVFYVAIDQYDSLYNNKWYPNAWSVQTLYDIMSPSKSLYFPDAAQGRLVGRKANNDSALHLNFVALADSSNPEIWHISHGWWSMMSVNDFPTLQNDFEDYKYARKAGPGVYPHLAAFPYVYDESYRWYNRRIFNNTFPNSTAKALSSVKWVFNKEGVDDEPDEKFYAFFGYRKDSTLRIIHSQPMLNRSGRSHKIAFSKEIDVKTLSMRDTLYSDWFEIDDIAIMEFIQANKSDKKSKYFIENQKGQKIEIGKIPMPSKAFNKRKIALTKGGGKAYRALWVKPEGAQYFEEGVIGNFESAAETMEGLNKSGMDERNEIEFVNLSAGQSNYENTLEIYPNPAESELYFNSNSLAVVEVYDLMGKCQMRFLDLKEPKIEVGALPAGVYILKVGVLQQKFIKY
ncbi:MAG: T9SS type A sorting domain-containing protein [Chloroflexota bacterium]